MLNQFFLIIELLLKLFGLWKVFNVYIDFRRQQEVDERKKARDKASDQLKNATTEEEFDRAQQDLVNNRPRP